MRTEDRFRFKPAFRYIAAWLLAVSLIAATGCSLLGSKKELPAAGGPTAEQPKPGNSGSDPRKEPGKPAATVEEQGQAVLQALKDKDMKKLASLVHPDKGVRFSPYGHIDVKTDLVFKPDALAQLMTDGKTYEWGVYDGSGEPIKLTFAEYYAKFVYDADFIKPQQSAVNRIIGQGNTASNLTDVYPPDSHDFIEYHFSGLDPKYEGMDWRSLRLVFEHVGDHLYLVGIVHDQWTI